MEINNAKQAFLNARKNIKKHDKEVVEEIIRVIDDTITKCVKDGKFEVDVSLFLTKIQISGATEKHFEDVADYFRVMGEFHVSIRSGSVLKSDTIDTIMTIGWGEEPPKPPVPTPKQNRDSNIFVLTW